MYQQIRQIPRAIVIALAAAAILVVLIPTCAMVSTCGSMQMGSLADLVNCESMWFASDAAPGVTLDIITLAFVVLFMAMIVLPTPILERVGVALHDAPIPHPPDDPLMGRLII